MAVAQLAAEERRLIRCAGCGCILAAQVAGLTVVTRRGYEWVGIVVSMKCARCGAIWRPSSPSGERVLDSG